MDQVDQEKIIKNGKVYMPLVTMDDLEEWKQHMSFVRVRTRRGTWPNGEEILKLMDEIYERMKEQFATGDGIWVLC